MDRLINTSIVSNGILLFVVTGVIIYGILWALKPPYVMKDKKKISYIKLILYAWFSSAVFTVGTVFVSIQVDKQYAKKKITS